MRVADITGRENQFSRLSPMRTKLGSRVLEGYITTSRGLIYGLATRISGNKLRLFVEQPYVATKLAAHVTNQLNRRDAGVDLCQERHIQTIYS